MKVKLKCRHYNQGTSDLHVKWNVGFFGVVTSC